VKKVGGTTFKKSFLKLSIKTHVYIINTHITNMYKSTAEEPKKISQNMISKEKIY
jgi:hypothetical protein